MSRAGSIFTKLSMDADKPFSLPAFYRDVEFRSRLEARWAAYFDLVGLSWQYEPEGYRLPSGNYCPDFECRFRGETSRNGFQDSRFFVEVKPTEIERAAVDRKLIELSGLTGVPVYCVVGLPSVSWQWAAADPRDDLDWVIFAKTPILAWGELFDARCFGDKTDDQPDFYRDEPYWRMAAGMRFENGVAMPWWKLEEAA